MSLPDVKNSTLFLWDKCCTVFVQLLSFQKLSDEISRLRLKFHINLTKFA